MDNIQIDVSFLRANKMQVQQLMAGLMNSPDFDPQSELFKAATTLSLLLRDHISKFESKG